MATITQVLDCDLERHEKSQLLPSRGLQFRGRDALTRGKGSESGLQRVLWKPRYGAAKLGQFSQMEIVKDLVGIYKLKDGKVLL